MILIDTVNLTFNIDTEARLDGSTGTLTLTMPQSINNHTLPETYFAGGGERHIHPLPTTTLISPVSLAATEAPDD